MYHLVRARLENLINRYHCRLFKITPRRDIGFGKAYTFPSILRHVMKATTPKWTVFLAIKIDYLQI